MGTEEDGVDKVEDIRFEFDYAGEGVGREEVPFQFRVEEERHSEGTSDGEAGVGCLGPVSWRQGKAEEEHQSIIGTDDQGFMALIAKVVQQSGQRAGYPIDLGEEVL